VLETNGQPSNPVFVVGVFRSGTSLLYSLLNQHPQIALMYECDVWDFPGVGARHRFSGDWLERQEFYNQALSRHRLIFGGKMRGLENIRTPDDLYRCHGNSKEARLWGEKSPVYATRLARLARQYPHGSFILIWRDPVEVYRSIRVAGKETPFFRRPGMLHRLIYQKEKMVREAGRLQRSGARIHHVNYDDLVDRTEATCRATCEFLGAPFHEEMLKLERADFSAIYQEPQHEFLRRGIIKRQNFSEAIVPPAEAAKLRRFASRWERLIGRRLGPNPTTTREVEASMIEQLYHRFIGGFFFMAENAKRLAFEFLPMPWLRTYRLFKSWVFSPQKASNCISIREQIREHGVTIFASFLLWAAIVGLDNLTGPEVSFGTLYLIPCATLALVVGRGWGSIAAMLNAVAITFLRFNGSHSAGHSSFSMDVVLIWNVFMRFILFQVFVLLLDRIRVELATRSSHANISSPTESPKGQLASGK
jgi:hypothetical protein